MKKLITLANCILLIIFTNSCSNEELNFTPQSERETLLSSYSFKRYEASTNLISDSIYYQIENNRIIKASGISNITDNPITSEANYEYINNRISQITTFENGLQIRRNSFSYDNTGNLSELLIESLDTNQQLVTSRHSFIHTQDTIQSIWEESLDGLDFNILVAKTKIVLDNNGNRIYAEVFNQRANDSLITINTYDTNNNMITDNNYRITNGELIENNFNTFTYDNELNLLNIVNEATYKRKNLILLYHLQASAVNGFTPRIISNNQLNTFETNFSPNTFRLEIQNTITEDGKTITNDFSTLANGELLLRFSLDFQIK